jgi:hypothetical protein
MRTEAKAAEERLIKATVKRANIDFIGWSPKIRLCWFSGRVIFLVGDTRLVLCRSIPNNIPFRLDILIMIIKIFLEGAAEL